MVRGSNVREVSYTQIAQGKLIPCPRCNQLIHSQAHYCEHCGVDLAIAAAVAEQDILPFHGNQVVSMAPEILVPRLGDYLREKGVLQEEDLQRALEYQKKLAKQGTSCLVGEALVQLGIINRETLDSAVTEQILQLQSALHDANRTLEKRVQERTSELQQALKRLAELNQLKSNFISNISHELRTPLTHIKGYLELLHDGDLGTLDENQLKAIDVALRSSRKLEKLIEDLLQFSLAVRGELSLKLEDIDFINLLRVMDEKYQKRAVIKDINLEFQHPDYPVIVRIDLEKIEWVMNQLLDNAVKFTTTGGNILVSAKLSNGIINICVSDTGIGIPQEKMSEIFQLFHQLDGSNTRKYQGTGLGLAFVYRILNAHGSQIIVNSEVGKGSQFEFSLPVISSNGTVL